MPVKIFRQLNFPKDRPVPTGADRPTELGIFLPKRISELMRREKERNVGK
jgi:hypothetical protein